MKKYLIVLIACIQLSCNHTPWKTLVVKNGLSQARREVVRVPLSQLHTLVNKINPELLQVTDTKDNSVLRKQLIDNDGDGKFDDLIFLPTIGANEDKEFRIEISQSISTDTSSAKTYSRFVPERIDDFAWENNVAAFRTYGPEAQRLVDDGQQGGTLSSGLDCWLKRVPYSVIDKWYAKPAKGKTYHKDDGEGYDPYHVGASRGCGGIGVWKNDSLYVSKNFISYKKITDGPIRNIFELTYAPWRVDNITISETKRITIDLDDQLYKIEDLLTTTGTLPNITIGITLHDKKGVVASDTSKGWFSYWEPIDDSEIGTGVVIDPEYLKSFDDYRTEKKELSQLHIITKPIGNKVTYYTGFGWSKAGTITSASIWNNYLNRFSERIASPLLISLK